MKELMFVSLVNASKTKKLKNKMKKQQGYTFTFLPKVSYAFQDRIENATSLAKEMIARRNLTMLVCAINVGLRGGDFCSLKWSDIFDRNWDYKSSADYVPEKTNKRDEDGNITKAH